MLLRRRGMYTMASYKNLVGGGYHRTCCEDVCLSVGLACAPFASVTSETNGRALLAWGACWDMWASHEIRSVGTCGCARAFGLQSRKPSCEHICGARSLLPILCPSVCGRAPPRICALSCLQWLVLVHRKLRHGGLFCDGYACYAERLVGSLGRAPCASAGVRHWT